VSPTPEPRRLTTLLTIHSIGAFCGTDTACSCDRKWRSNAEWRAHVAEAIAADLAAPVSSPTPDEQAAEEEEPHVFLFPEHCDACQHKQATIPGLVSIVRRSPEDAIAYYTTALAKVMVERNDALAASVVVREQLTQAQAELEALKVQRPGKYVAIVSAAYLDAVEDEAAKAAEVLAEVTALAEQWDRESDPVHGLTIEPEYERGRLHALDDCGRALLRLLATPPSPPTYTTEEPS
jgi:hypothetical protein